MVELTPPSAVAAEERALPGGPPRNEIPDLLDVRQLDASPKFWRFIWATPSDVNLP